MYREIIAKVQKESPQGTHFHVLVPNESLTDELKKLSNNGILKGELRIDDGRQLSTEQRKKTYAMLHDISVDTGYPPEELKDIMKYHYMGATGDDYFSLSNCSVTTARRFISHLIDFAFEWGIPLMDTAINRTDDISATLYSSLKHKRCITCGKDGEIIAWGHNEKMCLCPICLEKSQKMERKAFEKFHHVYGIKYQD